ACSAALPGGARLVVVLPGKGIEGRLQVGGGEIWIVMEQMPAELAPAEFAQEFVGIGRQGGALGRSKARRVPDLPRADLAKAQMRRERGRAVAVGPVAIAGISFEAVGEEALETLLGSGLTRRPGRAQAAGPIGMTWLELPVRKLLACDAGNGR